MAVNKNCWRSGHPCFLGIHDILINLLSDLGRGHVTFELVHLEAKLDGGIFNCLLIKSWQGKEGVMKFPEFTLFAGSKRGAGCRVGKLMHPQREIFQDNLNGIRIFFEHLLEKRRNLAAVRSLKIRKDRNDHRGLGRPEKRRANGIDVGNKVNGQVGKCLGLLVDEKEPFPARRDINSRDTFIYRD